jgi:hypothetical protein
VLWQFSNLWRKISFLYLVLKFWNMYLICILLVKICYFFMSFYMINENEIYLEVNQASLPYNHQTSAISRAFRIGLACSNSDKPTSRDIFIIISKSHTFHDLGRQTYTHSLYVQPINNGLNNWFTFLLGINLDLNLIWNSCIVIRTV